MFSMRNITTTLFVALIAALSLASTAFGNCGPEFTSKRQAVEFYKSDKGKKFLPSMKKWLVKNRYMQQDRDVIAFLESPTVVYTKTPKGFKFKSNTRCSGANYVPYHGLLAHSKMSVLAVRRTTTKKVGKPKAATSTKIVKTEQVQEHQADGSTNVYEVKTLEVTTKTKQRIRTCNIDEPFMKGYCRNVAKGKKYKKCKTKSKTTTKKELMQERKLLQTIPAPPTPVAPTPPAPPKVIVVTPPKPELPGPWVQADGSPAHLITGGNAVIYFRTARGATLSVLALGEGWVSGLRDVPYMWNDTTKSAAPCPSDATCWEARLWSEKGATVGSYLSVLAVAALNGKEVATGYDVRIMPDDFGDGKKAATVAPDTYAVDVSEL